MEELERRKLLGGHNNADYALQLKALSLHEVVSRSSQCCLQTPHHLWGSQTGFDYGGTFKLFDLRNWILARQPSVHGTRGAHVVAVPSLGRRVFLCCLVVTSPVARQGFWQHESTEQHRACVIQGDRRPRNYRPPGVRCCNLSICWNPEYHTPDQIDKKSTHRTRSVQQSIFSYCAPQRTTRHCTTLLLLLSYNHYPILLIASVRVPRSESSKKRSFWRARHCVLEVHGIRNKMMTT